MKEIVYVVWIKIIQTTFIRMVNMDDCNMNCPRGRGLVVEKLYVGLLTILPSDCTRAAANEGEVEND